MTKENEEEVQALKLALIRDYDSLVPGIAGLAGVSRIDAQEALHTAICRVLVGVKRRPPGNPVVAWRPYIIRTAMNVLKEEARRKARRRDTVLLFSELSPDQHRKLMEIRAPEPSPPEVDQRREVAALASEEVAKLPRYERDVIARRCHGQSFEEIAGALSIESATARGHWSRGIQVLRTRLRSAA